MVFVQYYRYGCITGELIQACGDRSIFILDGRNSLTTMINDSIKANKLPDRKYPAFQIFKGDNLLRSYPINNIIKTEYK